MLELASIFVLGIFAQWLAWKIKQPAILPLILIGLAIGPIASLFTADGSKLIDGDAIFSGDLLFSFVSIAVGVILFEGGLTLNLKEIRSLAGTVRNLLIIGALITFIGGGVSAHYIMGLSWQMSFLFGALIIVSGPTVVIPILRNVRPNTNVNTVLKWEGILIDPLGALIAVLMYEFILSSKHGADYPTEVFQDFFITVSAGIVSGGLGAFFLYSLIKNNALPSYLQNVFTLALVIFTFAVSEMIHAEAGLMAATVMGIALANVKLEELKKILSFKEDISVILISVLFILLSSRIDIIQIEKLGWESLILFLIIILIVRPLGVLLSTIGSHLNWREIVFISWIGPKGIVAAAVASLFSLDLIKGDTQIDPKEAELLLPLVFLIIVGTVVLQGSSAKYVAALLGVKRAEPKGILIVGANELARKVAQVIKDHGTYVLLVDTSAPSIKEAKKAGLKTLQANILSDQIFDEIDLSKIGKLVAMTSNSGLNDLACTWFEKELGETNVFRLASKEETDNTNLPLPKNVLFNARVDFVTLVQLIRVKNPFSEMSFESQSEYEDFRKEYAKRMIPLFLTGEGDEFQFITGYTSKTDKLTSLVYVKKPNFDSETVADDDEDVEYIQS
ncbi:MAG: sodium:proton antiporter [Marinoscillum sp.]|uniref:cation:proton antiporter n=1 Tax=Marinoscillum sp. TaxID=2024838 RepID=UPI0032FDF182